MERLNFFFIHGFLGRPQDWNKVIEGLPRLDFLNIHLVDYLNQKELGPSYDFSSWARRFNDWVESCTLPGDRNFLIGYSLGGRLGLHSLEANSKLWEQVLFVSTHPGFNDQITLGQGNSTYFSESSEREERWLKDSNWSQDFLTLPWDDLIAKWNGQEVFLGRKTEPLRSEKDYSRNALAHALSNWSLAKQNNKREVIRINSQKIIWLVGELDSKFLKLSEDLKKETQNLKLEVLPGASHRALFDCPEGIAKVLREVAIKSQ